VTLVRPRASQRAGQSDGNSEEALRVLIDMTPLLGKTTGIGRFTGELTSALCSLSPQASAGLELYGYAVTTRGRREFNSVLPGCMKGLRGWMPARPLHWCWSRSDFPDISWWSRSPQVVHGTNYVVPPAKRAGRLLSVHDLTFLRFPEMCQPAVLRAGAIAQRAANQGAWVQVPSFFVKQEVITSWHIPEERVAVVPYGVSFPATGGETTDSSSPRLGLLAPGVPDPGTPGGTTALQQPYILALGTVEPRKDLPTLVKAFDLVAKKVPELHLVLAGPEGWGDAEARLGSAISACSARDRVTRLGYVSEQVRVELLRGACLLAYPSLYEGFGLPPLEAMAAGVPVVATRAGSIPEVLGDAALLCDPGDAEALAECIEEVVLAPEADRADLVEKGKRHAGLFKWEHTASRMVELYWKVAENAQGGLADKRGLFE
jgi:glycosyltransferase involved in cell wall biosynthesis